MNRPNERTPVSAADEYRYDPGDGPRDRSLRVGDRERDAVGETLRKGHLEGRLDAEEFQARLERCMAAKTFADLDALVADLPREGGERRRPGRARSPRRPPFVLLLFPLALIAAVAAVGGHVAWLAVPLLFLFVVRPIAWRAWGGGPGRGSWACGPRGTTRI
jgi:hypothetical protein